MPQVAIGRGGPSASAAFHVELTETCVDLLARYATTPCTVKPQRYEPRAPGTPRRHIVFVYTRCNLNSRSDLAEFLFNGGQSMTWLVGHKLVTITTSGCLQNSLKQGLCDR